MPTPTNAFTSLELNIKKREGGLGGGGVSKCVVRIFSEYIRALNIHTNHRQIETLENAKAIGNLDANL